MLFKANLDEIIDGDVDVTDLSIRDKCAPCQPDHPDLEANERTGLKRSQRTVLIDVPALTSLLADGGHHD